VGGFFTNLAGQTRERIGRLNADGSLDETFNPGANDWVRSIVVQPDGRILVAGDFTMLGREPRDRLGRLNADGSLDSSFNPGANMPVWTFALQTDGTILAAGDFTMLGNQPRSRLGRLNADGTLDATFRDPGFAFIGGIVPRIWSLAVQDDGKILIGGDFDFVGGQPRRLLARLTSRSAAWQTLQVSSNGLAASWTRGGSGPEFTRVTFESSIDGVNYASIGDALRFGNTWQQRLARTPFTGTLFVRARGWTAGGAYSSSSGFIETVGEFYRLPPPRLFYADKFDHGPFQFFFSNALGYSFTVLASTNVAEPVANWEVLGSPVPAGNGLYRFTDQDAANREPRFYQLRAP
jgi:uncharacterized delta-60 repeat protein